MGLGARLQKRYVVAVSGGVDSVVLLDFLAGLPHDLLVVAHFDHGIRPDSAHDARFVQELARRYELPYESRREELGPGAGEDTARRRRYAFLREVAERYQATIATAHHADDVVETVAINVARGTGWRGLAVLNDPTIMRPLLYKWKDELIEYATAKRLEWVEDSTNHTDVYLRNRIRSRISQSMSPDQKRQLYGLWQCQVECSNQLQNEVAYLIEHSDVQTRYFMMMIPYEAAYELLREVVMREAGISLLKTQLEAGVLAIRTARPGTVHHLLQDVQLICHKSTWSIQRR